MATIVLEAIIHVDFIKKCKRYMSTAYPSIWMWEHDLIISLKYPTLWIKTLSWSVYFSVTRSLMLLLGLHLVNRSDRETSDQEQF